jgi:hypothetical protein
MRKQPGLSFIDNIEELRAIPSVMIELMELLNSYSPTPDIERAIEKRCQANILTAKMISTGNAQPSLQSNLLNHRQ